MKKLTIIIAAAALLIAGSLRAQTTTNSAPPVNTQSFLQSVQGFFTSFNTDLTNTFVPANDTFDLWTGAEYVNNVGTAATLGLSYNAFKLSSATIGFESVTRNAGINGIILSQGVGVNIQKNYLDMKFVGYLEGAYDFDVRKPYAEIGTRIFKALTPNTYAGVGIGERIGSGQISRFPVVSLFAGFKF